VRGEQVLAEDLRELLIIKSKKLQKQSERGFVQGLDEVAGLLSKYDPAYSPLLKVVDQKGGDIATYFIAAYSDSNDFDRSILVYQTVKTLVRYIVLMDRYYEVGNNKYEKIARGFLRSIKKMHDGPLKYSLDFWLERSWPYWDFEQVVKKLMIKGYTFSFRELRHFSLFKSSDAPMIYAPILDNELPNFNQNVAGILHYNQALQDLYDDFEDIEEDVHDMMPNVFILAATEHMPISKILKNPSHAQRLVISSGAADSILLLVEQYNKMIKDVTVPANFAFLKYLSNDYTDRLLKMMNVIPR
jgi:hypothetical protein